MLWPDPGMWNPCIGTPPRPQTASHSSPLPVTRGAWSMVRFLHKACVSFCGIQHLYDSDSAVYKVTGQTPGHLWPRQETSLGLLYNKPLDASPQAQGTNSPR